MCKEERDGRAMDIANRLLGPKSREVAVKVAQQTRRHALAQALYDAGRTSTPSLTAPSVRRPSVPTSSSALFNDEPLPARPMPHIRAAHSADAATSAVPSAVPTAAAVTSSTPVSAARPLLGGRSTDKASGVAKPGSAVLATPAAAPVSPSRAGSSKEGSAGKWRECLSHARTTAAFIAGSRVMFLPALPKNPFAKTVMASPSKRARDASVLDKLLGASPPQKKLLSRSSTFAEEGAHR
jgi:hypothetical protein